MSPQWMFFSAVFAACITAYFALIYFPSDAIQPYLTAFGLIWVVFIYLNPQRRYFRLGAGTVFIILSPLTVSGFVHFRILDVGSFDAALLDPGWPFYVTGAAIAAMCFAADCVINEDSLFRLFFGTVSFLSGNQIALGRDTNQTIISNNSGPVTLNTGIHNWPDPSGIHAEVTAAANKTLDGMPDVAIALLNPLLVRAPADDKRLRFRIHANLGFAHLERNDVHLAKAEFERALQHENNTEEAAGFEALIYFIGDDDTKAFTSAGDAIRRFPLSARAMSIYIQTAPVNHVPQDFNDIIKPPLDQDIDVLLALSRRAGNLGHFPEALNFARRAISLKPDSPRLLEHLASTIFNEQGLLFREYNIAAGPKPNTAALREAISIHQNLVSKGTHLTGKTLSRIHHQLALCQWVVGDMDAAEQEFATALNLNSTTIDARRHFAQFQIKQGKTDLAIAQLRLIPAPDRELEDHLFLAMMLISTGDPNDELEAFTLLRDRLEELRNASQEVTNEWLAILCQSAFSTGNSEWFEKEHDRLASFSTRPWMTWAFKAEREHSRNNKEEATESLRRWVELLDSTDSVKPRQRCARLCQLEKLYDLAFEAWQPVAVASPQWPYWHYVLDCAMASHNDSFVLSYCEQLRTSGCLDPHCLHSELDIFGKYHDDSKAIDVINSYLDKIEDDAQRKILRVRLSVFAIRLGRIDIVETDDTKLPPASSVDEQCGIWTTELFRRLGLREKAVRYAYELLRRFGHSSNINMVYISAFDLGASDIRTDSDCIAVDDAVQYQEDDTGKENWIILESTTSLLLASNEIGPSHPLSKSLFGKRVGDSFVLRPDDIQPRSATIKKFHSKFAYRAVDILDSWEHRFPGVHFVKKFVAPKGPDGTPDVSAMIRTLNVMSADEEIIRQTYINNPFGIAIYSRMCHLTHIQAAYKIGIDPEMPNRCSTGSRQESDNASAIVHADSIVVLDPSSITTLFVTGVFDLLKEVPLRYLVTQSTMMTLQNEMNRINSGRTPAGYMRSVNGRVQYAEHDTESHAQYVERLRQFIEWFESKADMRGGSDAAKLPRASREQYEELFGAAYLESACLASEQEAIHWTDDVTVALMLDRDMKVRRTWTQAIFSALVQHGKVSGEFYQKLTVELLRFGVESTHWTLNIAIAAAKASEWKAEQRPVRAIVQFFDQGDAASVVGVATQICVLVENEPIVTSPMNDFLVTIMRRIASRNDGKSILDFIRRGLPIAFGINAASAARVDDLIEHALETTNSSHLFLP